MKFAATILCIVLVAVANAQFYTHEQLNAQFEQFKNDYNREYSSASEEELRKQIFTTNLNYIFRHNRDAYQGAHSYILGLNEHADLSPSEFVRKFNGYQGAKAPQMSEASAIYIDESVSALPDTVDWTTKGVVTPIKNQGQCGSCWAFSAIASMEGQHALKTGKLVSLSEQNLVDCSYSQGDLGCFGGLMDNAFKYVISNKGVDTESAYPYTGTYFELCKFKKTTVGATISSYVDVKSGCENALQNAVATIGPISVAIDASQQSFQLYKSGVYNEPACSSTTLDHGVTVVGYGTQSGTPYWKVKNSWGTSWGEQGYILMSRNKQNQCGIATNASYPLV